MNEVAARDGIGATAMSSLFSLLLHSTVGDAKHSTRVNKNKQHERKED